jgi:hypothetical protein
MMKRMPETSLPALAIVTPVKKNKNTFRGSTAGNDRAD